MIRTTFRITALPLKIAAIIMGVLMILQAGFVYSEGWHWNLECRVNVIVLLLMALVFMFPRSLIWKNSVITVLYVIVSSVPFIYFALDSSGILFSLNMNQYIFLDQALNFSFFFAPLLTAVLSLSAPFSMMLFILGRQRPKVKEAKVDL